MNADIDYAAYPKQKIFHISDSDETIYGGAKGGGKSAALVMDAVAYAVKFPKSKIYLFRKTYDELEANLIDELHKRVPEKTKECPTGLYKYDKSLHIATFLNGSRIYFRYCRNIQDARKYAGREMDYLGIDELTQHTKDVIELLKSCVRSPRGYPTRFKATCNPGGVGHIYVKRTYIVPTLYGKKRYKDKKTGNIVSFIPAKVYDNLAIMTNDPKYVRRLEGLSPSLKKAFLEGNWDIFEDQKFQEFNAEIHVCKSFSPPQHWKRWLSADNGYTDPFAWYWFAVDEQGRIHVYREFTREYEDPKLSYKEQAQKVLEMSKCLGPDEWGEIKQVQENLLYKVIGHDAFSATPLSNGKCIVDFYNEGGLTGFTSANTDRKAGAAVVHEYLLPYIDQNDNKTKAKLIIHDCCKSLIEMLPQQIPDEKDVEKVALTDYDHQYDALRYGLLSYHAAKTKPAETEKTALQKAKEAIIKRNRMTASDAS